MSSSFLYSTSPEEAGALLGAMITFYGQQKPAVVKPPAGMHSTFATRRVPSADLILRLHALRAALRGSVAPLPSSLSLLAVLKKFMDLSSNRSCTETPVLQSTPIRRLWVDCVVLCFVLGDAPAHAQKFVRDMMAKAGAHPRSKEGAGGIRVAALQVTGALFREPVLRKSLATWTFEVLQLCGKALKSAGHGEPSYRVTALQTAAATAMASRSKESLVLVGVVEHRAITEVVRTLRLAAADKFPEVRAAAARCAALWAPLLVPSDNSLQHLDEATTLVFRNLDDESPYVALEWAEAWARCLAAATALGETANDKRSRKPQSLVHTSKSLKDIVRYLVEHFVKVGGELVAPRMGGSYSVGGRAVRVGISSALKEVLTLYFALGSLGDDAGMTASEVLRLVLPMLGDELVKQTMPTTEGGMFGGGASRTFSRADGSVARQAVASVIRHGIVEIASEAAQIAVLKDIITMLETTAGPLDATKFLPNGYQLQVLLVEVSYIVSSLGAAASSNIDDLVSQLKNCLGHTDTGVRHEAAVATAALASNFAATGRSLIRDFVREIQEQHADMVTAVVSSTKKHDDSKSGMRMFRRQQQAKEGSTDATVTHQYAIHGRALAVSLLLRDLPRMSDGLPAALLATALSVSEVLVSCQFNDILTKANPAVVCTCVRAGFVIIAGGLTTGPSAVASHIALIFAAWQKSAKAAKEGGQHLAARHDLFCIDAALASVVVFLKDCPELLLSVPDALSEVSVLLETILPLLVPGGRLCSMDTNATIVAFLETSRAAMLEAFAWLPSGSFPMAADSVFTFSAKLIHSASENEISCSLLQSLVRKEDELLDATSFARARREGQAGGSASIEELITLSTAEATHHSEREAVLHLLTPSVGRTTQNGTFLKSHGLAFVLEDKFGHQAPTPLHEVGAWRRPVDPSTSSKIRLVDAAVQAFAATFGMKSTQEQQSAMDMLEGMIPPLVSQLARAIGVGGVLADNDRRARVKEDVAAVENITAVLLSCLQALPLHEAAHNTRVDIGPPWMQKAKDLLLTLLPSDSHVVRRGAAEGLALLATIGVAEDGHMLQSSVLHSLDEVMQGNKPDGKVKAIALESISAARSGSLHTLSCIQRTASNIADQMSQRLRSRSVDSKPDSSVTKNDFDLPFFQMLSRTVPSASCSFNDYFAVRTHALHSFCLLLSYSGRAEAAKLSTEDLQLLRKAVELVESNFASSWVVVSVELDKGQEAERMTTEVAFAAALVRLMTLLVPFLAKVREDLPDVGQSFAVMTSLIAEAFIHPTVAVESMAFYEVLSQHQSILPRVCESIPYTENAIFSCLPVTFETVRPWRKGVFAAAARSSSESASSLSLLGCCFTLKRLVEANINVAEWTDMRAPSCFLARLEDTYARRSYFGVNAFRTLAAPRAVYHLSREQILLEEELASVLLMMVPHVNKQATPSSSQLRWLLSTLLLLSNASNSPLDEIEGVQYTKEEVVRNANQRAFQDLEALFNLSDSPRWQTKTVAAHAASFSLRDLIRTAKDVLSSSHFNPKLANESCTRECDAAKAEGAALPESKLVFHVQNLVTTACMSVTASVDQSELEVLQAASVPLLRGILEGFASIEDPEVPESGILEQFEQQIFSAIKHALTLSSHRESRAVCSLFLAGGEAVLTMVRLGVTKDPAVIKRLTRSVIPQIDSNAILKLNECVPLKEEGDFGDTRCSLSTLLTRLHATGVLFLRPPESLGPSVAEVSLEILLNPTVVASHCAAAALDGTRVLTHRGLSLGGSQKNGIDKATFRGTLVATDSDIDHDTLSLLVSNWSSFALSATAGFLQASSEASDTASLVSIKEWMSSILTLAFQGVHDCLIMGSEGTPSESYRWCRSLDPDVTLRDCLSIIQLCIRSMNDRTDLIDVAWIELPVGALVESIRERMIMPSCSGDARNEVSLQECCRLLRLLAHHVSHLPSCTAPLLVTVLSPLDLLGTDQLRPGSASDEIVVSCLEVSAYLMSDSDANELLLESLLSLVLTEVLNPEKTRSEAMIGGGLAFVGIVTAADSLNRERTSATAMYFASRGLWKAWSTVALPRNFDGVDESVKIMRKLLEDSSQSDSHKEIISLLLNASQDTFENVGPLSSAFGDVVLSLLHMYGSSQVPDGSKDSRQAICTQSMKFILLSYQKVVSEGSDELATLFLETLFRNLLPVVRYNGLPNHPAPNTDSNPLIGRLCAQAIVLTAKQTPNAFKASLLKLDHQVRTLLEFAVRAEMTGYATQSQNTGKKQLNLSNFKR